MRRSFAHPAERGESDLLQHCLKVAERAKELAAGFGTDVSDAAYYSGLLHDLGKLNPYYQILFSSEPFARKQLQTELQSKYVRAHSIFSALAAHRLLSSMDYKKRNQVVFAVASHHTQLSQMCQSLDNYLINDCYSVPFRNSRTELIPNLEEYSKSISNIKELYALNWGDCIKKFSNDPDFPKYRPDCDSLLEYLEFSAVFSALLIADRGSFYDWGTPSFDIRLDTEALSRSSTLSKLRDDFQKGVLLNNDLTTRMVVLEAPTGIGKTKLFLDIAQKIAKDHHLKSIFYFSPLLALTDDFESKLVEASHNGKKVLSEESLDDVLVYTHIHAGTLRVKLEGRSLDDKGELDTTYSLESFEAESFNKKMVITTTQRLLMTLYSNKCADKIKLLSFRDSLLIIDEIQTIPKFLLPNLLSLLKLITEKLNARIILVSATVPYQIRNAVPLLTYPPRVNEDFLKATRRKIALVDNIAPHEVVANGKERVLAIFNTRKKARDFFEEVVLLEPSAIYLSSGMRKDKRRRLIEDIRASNTSTVVSTQVMEAGVDVSFTRMYREMAPLDNIIQAMGRLNREAELELPTLYIFNTDKRHEPYSELEYVLSEKVLKTPIHHSDELYARLNDYYRSIDETSLKNRVLADKLKKAFDALDFDAIWQFVRSNVLPADSGQSVFIPDADKWEAVKDYLLRSEDKSAKRNLKKYMDLTAELPGEPETLGIVDLFDQDLYEKGVFMPREDAITEVYDEKIGLDKWIKGD